MLKKIFSLLVLIFVILFARSNFADKPFSITGQVILPDSAPQKFSDLELQMYLMNDVVSDQTFSIDADGNFIIDSARPGTYLVLQEKRVPRSEPTGYLVAKIYSHSKNIEVSPASTAVFRLSMIFERENASLAEAEKIKIDKIILEKSKPYADYIHKKLVANEFTLMKIDQSTEYRKMRSSVRKEIQSAVRAAVKSGHIDPNNKVEPEFDPEHQELLADFITCKENPETFEENPERMMKMQQFMRTGLTKSELPSPKHDMIVFGAKVDKVMLGGIGTSPGFAAILDGPSASIISNMRAEGIDLGQCADTACQKKVHDKLTFMVTGSSMMMGSAGNTNQTFVGCIYPYVP